MKINFLNSLFLGLIMISCKGTVQRSSSLNTKSIDTSFAVNMDYKINRIDSIDNIYVIYAERFGKHFKIVTPKKVEVMDCNKIEVDSSYKFILTSIITKEIKGVDVYSNTALHSSYDFHGTSLKIEPDSILDIHTTRNLAGLCYLK